MASRNVDGHACYLLAWLKLSHLHFFAWLRNNSSFYGIYSVRLGRKQSKLAGCRINRS